MERSTGTPNDGKDPAQRKRLFPHWLMWAGGVMLVLLVAGVAVVAYVLHNAEPILRRRVIASLEERFRAPEIGRAHV